MQTLHTRRGCIGTSASVSAVFQGDSRWYGGCSGGERATDAPNTESTAAMMNRLALALAALVSVASTACGNVDDLPTETTGSATADYNWAYDSARGLRIGTWNLKRLGQGDKRLDLVARVIDTQFDIIAVQEVMTPTALQPLMDLLPGWSAQLSERAVGRSGYYEYYAVLYRSAQATVTSSRVVDDAADEWYREPMVTCMRANAADFCLVVTHIVYGTTVGPRDAEIQALGRLVSGLRAAGTEKDYVVLGDYNRQASAPGFSTLQASGWAFNDDGTVRTTLGTTSYSNPYDHAMIDPGYTREWTGLSGRFDLVGAVCGGSYAFCAQYVSDHAPVGVLFAADASDDD